MSGCTIEAVPSCARASLHSSRKWVLLMCQWHCAAVSSSNNPTCTRDCALRRASPNLRSAGALKTGLPPSTTSRRTVPALRSWTRLSRPSISARPVRERIGDDDRRADVAQRVVDRVRDGMHRRGLTRADRHNPLAARGEQILHRGADKGVDVLRAERAGRAALDAGKNGTRDRVHLTGLQRLAMVGHQSGRRRRRFGDVETVHLGPGAAHSAPRGEVARVADVARGSGAEQIRVERDDGLGLIELVVDVDRLAEGEHPALVHAVRRDRVVLVPFGAGHPREDTGKLRGERRRRRGLAEEMEAGPAKRLQFANHCQHRGGEAGPGANLAEVRDRATAIGVVHRRDRRLREQVGRAKAGRMLRVAFELGGPSYVAFRQQASGDPAKGHRRRKKQRPAGHHFFWLADVRNQQFVGLPGARGRPRPGRWRRPSA